VQSHSRWSHRRRKEFSWGLILCACVLAVSAVLVAQWKEGPSWMIVVLAFLAGVGGVVLGRLKEVVGPLLAVQRLCDS